MSGLVGFRELQPSLLYTGGCALLGVRAAAGLCGERQQWRSGAGSAAAGKFVTLAARCWACPAIFIVLHHRIAPTATGSSDQLVRIQAPCLPECSSVVDSTMQC